MITTVGRILVNEALPEELRSEAVMDKSHMDKVLGALIQSDPDKYVDVSHKLLKLGGRIAYEDGVTIRLSDLRSPIPELRDKVLADLAKDVERVRKSNIDPEAARKQVLALYGNAQKLLTDATYDAALAADNPLALQVRSKARGNKGQLSAVLTTPGLYTDRNDEVIPKFIGRSFAQGLDEDEYWAGTYGARKSVIATKRSTAKAGALGKQFSASAYRTIVTADDCGTGSGMPVVAEDADNIGSVLAQDAGRFKAGTVVTRHVHSALRKDGVKDIVLRSPVTCGQPTGVCAQCTGIRERGRFPTVNEHVGISATTALAERVAQGTLNCLMRGTLVRMADYGTLRIEDIRVGDHVLGSDLHGNVFPVLVTHVWDQGPQPVADYWFRDPYAPYSVMVTSTEIHPLLTASAHGAQVHGYARPAGYVGDAERVVVIGTDEKPLRYAHILTENHRTELCNDITIDHPDHMFVLASGLVVGNTKHSGGQKSEFGGFADVENITKMPQAFPRKAALAPTDGVVTGVDAAPHGGIFITVGDERVHVPHGFGLRVKVGDTVEAGDVMSDGIPDPREVVRHKGLGEGRRYFVHKLTDAFRGGGYEVNRRNVELLGRAMLDHVRVTDPDGIGDLLPDEIVPYSTMAFSYKPRDGGMKGAPTAARGMYLEQPALHYTIGTRVTKSVAENLDKYGVKSVSAHKDPPLFEAQAVGLRELPGMETDWMAQLSSSYLKSNLLDNAAHNATSDIHGTHPIPGIAKGTEFGKLKPGQKIGF